MDQMNLNVVLSGDCSEYLHCRGEDLDSLTLSHSLYILVLFFLQLIHKGINQYTSVVQATQQLRRCCGSTGSWFVPVPPHMWP